MAKLELKKEFTIDGYIVELKSSFCGIDVYHREVDADEEFLYFVKDGVVVATHYISADMGQGTGFIADSSFEVKLYE